VNHSPFNQARHESTPTREDRQRAEILDGIEAGRLQHAADLAHEHLAEFPHDQAVRSAITAALDQSPDQPVRRRAGEFEPNEFPTPQVSVTETGDVRRCR